MKLSEGRMLVDEEVRLEPVDLDQPAQQARFRPYYSLLWFSRRLGRVAAHPITNVKDNVKEVLTKERNLPTTEQLLGTSTPFNDLRRKPKSKQEVSNETLQNIVERSHEVLAEATTIFPFKLFPDTVVVDRTKITIIKRNFFWSEDVVSIRIEDILNANSGVDLFFGSLNVSSRVMNSTDHYLIKFLWKHDAMHLKHLIQGYVIAQHNNIDVSHLSRDDLIRTLCELGDDTRGTTRP